MSKRRRRRTNDNSDDSSTSEAESKSGSGPAPSNTPAASEAPTPSQSCTPVPSTASSLAPSILTSSSEAKRHSAFEKRFGCAQISDAEVLSMYSLQCLVRYPAELHNRETDGGVEVEGLRTLQDAPNYCEG